MKRCYGLSSPDEAPTRMLSHRSISLVVFSILYLLTQTLFAQSASHVVISEVYGGGGNSGAPWTNDYIELYNPTSSAVSLTGWSVQYASATGTTWTKTDLTGSIPAYGFFLIQQASGGASGSPLPTPDATGTISMSATAGKVALVNTSTALSGANPTDASIIDRVGYGTTANGFEGSGSAPPPSNTKSAERKARGSSDATKLAAAGVDEYAGNGEDSNDNANDFVAQSTIVPQNSSSEIEGLRVRNTTTDAYFGRIQRAIDQAAASQTLDVVAGTYSETISLTKNLTITSGAVPSIVGDVTVNSSVSVTLNANVSIDGNVGVQSSGATLTVAATKTLTTTANVNVQSGGTMNGGGTFVSNNTGVTITNGGIISVATIQLNGGASPKYLAGTGAWSNCNLTIAAACSLELGTSQTFNSCSITNHGSLEIFGYAFKMIGGSFTNASDGYVHGYYDSFETEGAVTIIQNGSFYETLVVNSGTTTTSGTYPEPIIVKPNGTLAIPSGETLTVEDNVTVEQASPSYGRINGPGSIAFKAYGDTLTNNGVLSASTTFINVEGGLYYIAGNGTWGNVLIEPSVEVKLSGNVTMENVNLTVNGDLNTQLNTLTLGSTATITETAPYSVVGRLQTTRICTTGVNQTFGGVGVEINATAGPPGSTAVTRYTGTAPTFPPGTPIKRYFDIVPTTNSGLNAAFVFYYQEGELNGNTESGLLLYKSTDGGSTWTSQGGSVNTGSNTITLSGVNQFSRWTAGGLGNPAPTLATIAPTAVELGATRDIVVTGTGFVSGVSTPDFGSDITLNSLTVNSSTQMTANISVSPTGAIGARSVSVTNSSPGGGTATLTNALTVVYPPPTLGSISPNAANRGQTLNVVFTGEGYYAGTTSVSFGANVTVNSLTITNTTQLTANITVDPNAATGLRGVTANNSDPGGGSSTLQNAFTINNPAPTLTSVSPANGNRNQTLSVVVRGSNFLPGISSVNFGPDITVSSTTVDSSTQITASISISASAATGSRNVTVTHPAPGGGTATLTDAFTIGNPAPSLTNVSPNTGARGETMSVTLTGSDFIDGVSSASFGAGITMNFTTVNSATQMAVNITIALDAALEPRDISVTNAAPGGGTATMSRAFNVINPAPTLASIAPTSGSRGQTLNVTVIGTNFIPGVTTFAYGSGITINSMSAFNSTQVTASVTIDIGTTPGSRDVTATNAAPGGGSATLTNAFSVTNPLPTLTGASPNRAGRESKINVVLTGTNFLAGVSSVGFGPDVTVNSITMSSITQMLVNISVSSSASTGARNVSVTNATPGGGTATLTAGFTVDTSPATSVENTLSAIPEDYALHEAYPNPFNPSTKIRYGLPERSRVKLEVYNMLGNVVADLASGERSKGFYEVEWIADNLPSGVYLVRLFSESVETNKRFIASRKVVLVK